MSKYLIYVKLAPVVEVFAIIELLTCVFTVGRINPSVSPIRFILIILLWLGIRQTGQYRIDNLIGEPEQDIPTDNKQYGKSGFQDVKEFVHELTIKPFFPEIKLLKSTLFDLENGAFGGRR